MPVAPHPTPQVSSADMPVDLAVAIPAFLDLTVVGLDVPPALGEERFASDLWRSPGGGAITAVGAARLGLSTVLVAALGDDLAGELIRAGVAEDGVTVVVKRSPRTPTTIVIPVADDRAMITIDRGVRVSRSDVEPTQPKAVAVNLDLLHAVPPGAAGYVTCGEDDARAYAARPPAGRADMRALFVSQREALALTAAGDVDSAVEQLGKLCPVVVVMLGAEGAKAIIDGEHFSAPALEAVDVIDTTGAGDLFVAAYIWAELGGAPPEDRLRWSCVYAGLSITKPTGVGGAVTESRLLEQGAQLGLVPPPAVSRSHA
jgi:sugar/nucleoside kinase (ribokinase family)